jgi:hypothetical protein
MAAKEIVVKKYVVRLSCGERSLLETLIRKGSSPAHRLLKARILLKADIFEAGEGCSDNQIIQTLATSALGSGRFSQIAALDGHWQGRTIAVMLWHTKAGDIGASRADNALRVPIITPPVGVNPIGVDRFAPFDRSDTCAIVEMGNHQAVR